MIKQKQLPINCQCGCASANATCWQQTCYQTAVNERCVLFLLLYWFIVRLCATKCYQTPQRFTYFQLGTFERVCVCKLLPRRVNPIAQQQPRPSDTWESGNGSDFVWLQSRSADIYIYHIYICMHIYVFVCQVKVIKVLRWLLYVSKPPKCALIPADGINSKQHNEMQLFAALCRVFKLVVAQIR